MSCVDPGVFTGASNENFEEFVRRFRRKYEECIGCEAAPIEILGDDHLGSRAKNDQGIQPGRGLKRIGQANPDCKLEDRSLEYAQILLDNLSVWPEHFQL
ncbi:hypothetical protein OSTOST_02671 [Ostertagia ostertagi]